MKKKNTKKNERQEVVDTIKKGLKPQKEPYVPKSLPTFPPICHHCWHNFHGAIWMVIPPGRVLKQCCKCLTTKTLHVAHDHWHWPNHDIIWCGEATKY